jgi:hypothetical protein
MQAANGSAIPAIGFGTFGMIRADMLRMIPVSLAGGFRHIDTAQIYGNEAEVGECIQTSGIPRSQLFLTTKVWPANYREPAFTQSVEASLRRLRTDYLVHESFAHPGEPGDLRLRAFSRGDVSDLRPRARRRPHCSAAGTVAGLGRDPCQPAVGPSRQYSLRLPAAAASLLKAAQNEDGCHQDPLDKRQHALGCGFRSADVDAPGFTAWSKKPGSFVVQYWLTGTRSRRYA